MWSYKLLLTNRKSWGFHYYYYCDKLPILGHIIFPLFTSLHAHCIQTLLTPQAAIVTRHKPNSISSAKWSRRASRSLDTFLVSVVTHHKQHMLEGMWLYASQITIHLLISVITTTSNTCSRVCASMLPRLPFTYFTSVHDVPIKYSGSSSIVC